MIKFLAFSLLLVMTACTKVHNKIILNKKPDDMLIGYCKLPEFEQGDYAKWYEAEYNSYNVSEQDLATLIPVINEVDILIVMGTWCGDSRREFPRFIKILDTLNYPKEKLRILAVDRTKSIDEEGYKKLKIQFVPTIIISRVGNEIGRIVESPKVSLERDLFEIIVP